MPKHITQKQKEEIVNYYIQKPITIKALATLFKILDTPVSERDEYLEEEAFWHFIYI